MEQSLTGLTSLQLGTSVQAWSDMGCHSIPSWTDLLYIAWIVR